MLKAAVIGVGSMGKNHARVYSELDGVELVAVADANPAVNKARQRPWKRFYTDYKELLDKERPDLVTIAVPTTLHRDVGLEVIGRGINVLIEKPIASTLDEAEELIQAAAEKNVVLMVGHIERFNPAVRELKRRIESGELGKVYKVDVNRVGPIPPRIEDVGVVIDLAVHDIDVMRYLSGTEPKRIFAETAQRLHAKREDLLSGVLRLRDDTICYLNVNWLTPTNIRELHITGEKGMFVIDYIDQSLHFYENIASTNGEESVIAEGRMIRFKIEKREPLRNELEHFVACVNEGKEPSTTGRDGHRALDIALKLIKSAAEGRAIDD